VESRTGYRFASLDSMVCQGGGTLESSAWCRAMVSLKTLVRTRRQVRTRLSGWYVNTDQDLLQIHGIEDELLAQ
jgi:hypothetical protein